jgi:TonB-linked SusC/RagA family outer membrane protein
VDQTCSPLKGDAWGEFARSLNSQKRSKTMEKTVLNHAVWLKVMRISLIQVLLTAFFAGMTYATETKAQLLDKRVTVHLDNSEVSVVLRKLEKMTAIKFVFSPQVIKSGKKINVNFKDESLGNVLEKILRPLNIKYEISGKYILLTEAAQEPINSLSPKNVGIIPQTIDISVTGMVTDESGLGLPGVSVLVKGTQRGVITDPDGRFKISVVNGNAALVFSYVGYESKEVLVGSQSQLSVSLRVDNKSLNEVVVVGYGTQKKSDVTGSVASVSRERLEQLPNTNIAQALQGAIPGLQINTNSGGAEGNDNSILIRGRNSISASTSPLIIWDGIPYTGGISEINPNDVESIEILKDASAAAIYGARASNGVILITSKQGKKGKLNITYDGFYGVQNIANKPNLMTGAEFYDFKKNRLNIPANSITPTEQSLYDAGKAVDWYDLATRQGSRSQHTLSIAGGTDKISFYLGGTYLDVQGIAVNDQFKRYSIRPNLDIKVTPWLTIGSSSQLSFQDRSGRPADFAGQFGANVMNPLTTAFNADGTPTIYAWPEYNTAGNPLGETLALNKDNSYRVFSANNIKIDFPFLKGLSYKLNTGVEYDNTQRKTYYGIGTAVGYENKGSATNYSAIERNFTTENILTFSRDFGKHSLNVTALYSSQSHDYDRDQLRGVGFPNDVLTNYQMNAATLLTPSYENYKQNLVSQMGRINYGFDSRYLLTLTMRRDGFSGFGVNSKYGVFPSIAFGWNISREAFMKNIGFVSNLKLRGSYGLNGNQAVSSYQSLATLATRQYLNGATVLTGYLPNKLANEKLGWESTTSMTLGLDFGFFNNRIQGSLDIYSGKTQDLLLNRIISSVQGFDRILQNIGKTANRGIELGITTVNIKTTDFKWSSNLNLSHNKNKIVDLYGDGRDDVANGWFIGKPIRTIFGLQNAGIFTSQSEVDASAQPTSKPGYVRVKDVDGDNKISTTLDRTILGYSDPKLVYGFSNTFTYKGFSLMIFVNGLLGVTKENPLEQDDVFGDVRRNTTKKDWWSVANSSGTHFANDALANTFNVRFYENAGFGRLKDLSLAYQLPASVVNRLKLNKLKVYVTGRNLATFTNYTGLDPEINNQLDVPLQREFILGFNIGL